MALVSEAVLTALDHYVENGGGSRGARAICDPDGEALPMARTGPLSNCRFRLEKESDKHQQIMVTYTSATFVISTRENRRLDENEKAFFERDWPAWLTGSIYDLQMTN